MFVRCLLLYFVGLSVASDNCEPASRENPAGYQLQTFKQCTKKPIGIITSNNGHPIDIRDTNGINDDILYNRYVFEGILKSAGERIPERMVHAKGAGAFGYFEVTHDITDICSANLFDGVGKKTPLAARFSPSLQNKGGSDLVNEDRGCAFKFYTKEGNLDLVGFHTPVYLYRDPAIFGPVVHAATRNAATNLKDISSLWDVITYRPEVLHNFLWLVSDFGMPNGYRHMPCFPVHTYEVVNKKGESHFIRFNFTTDQGIQNLGAEEARRIAASYDPDYYVRDLYNAITSKRYPSWTIYIDILTKKQIENAKFDPFDVTATWPKGSYIQKPVGRLVLNKNPKNFFADVEQLALHPSNLVPGILPPADIIFKSRILSYTTTQNHRLGFNHNKISVNRPLYAKTYYRDGTPPVGDNMKDAPNYYPSSFNGPVPIVDVTRPKQRLQILQTRATDLQPSYEFYTHVLNAAQRKRLIQNLVFQVAQAVPIVQKNLVNLLYDVHPELGRGLAVGLQTANATLPTPVNILYYP